MDSDNWDCRPCIVLTARQFVPGGPTINLRLDAARETQREFVREVFQEVEVRGKGSQRPGYQTSKLDPSVPGISSKGS